MLGLHHVPRVDVLAQLGAEAALLHVEEVDHGEDDEHDGADQAVHPEDHGGAVLPDQHPAEDGPAEPAEPVVDALEEALHGGSQLGVRVVGDEAAAGGPDSGVGDPWSRERA